MKQIWMSDLHVGIRGHPADDFGGKDREILFYNLLRELNNRVDFIGLNGDIFELWQFAWEDVKDSRPIIFEALDSYVDCLLYGNHDESMPSEIAGIRVAEKYISDKSIYVSHGHEYDSFNNDDFGLIGTYIAKFGGWLEAIFHPDVDVWFSRIQNLFSDGRYGSNEEYFRKMRESNPAYNTQIIGHTHELYADCLQRNKAVTCNTGTWVNGEEQMVMIDYNPTMTSIFKINKEDVV